VDPRRTHRPALDLTIEQEMRAEAQYLQKHGAARSQLKTIVDGPDAALDRIIRSVRESRGTISGKLRARYPILERLEIAEDVLRAVREKFPWSAAKSHRASEHSPRESGRENDSAFQDRILGHAKRGKRARESGPGTLMLTGHIRRASIRQLPSQLATILIVLSLLTVDGRLQRCFYEAQLTQPTTKRLMRSQYHQPHRGISSSALGQSRLCAVQSRFPQRASLSAVSSCRSLKTNQRLSRCPMLTVHITSAS
jgi:hypothetical protein